jgi:hypothetical protein
MIQPPETKPVHRFTKNPFHEVGSNLTDKDLTLGTNALAHFYGASVTKEKKLFTKGLPGRHSASLLRSLPENVCEA